MGRLFMLGNDDHTSKNKKTKEWKCFGHTNKAKLLVIAISKTKPCLIQVLILTCGFLMQGCRNHVPSPLKIVVVMNRKKKLLKTVQIVEEKCDDLVTCPVLKKYYC